MKTVTVELTARDIALLCLGLLRRMDNMPGYDDLKDSYDHSKELLRLLKGQLARFEGQPEMRVMHGDRWRSPRSAASRG